MKFPIEFETATTPVIEYKIPRKPNFKILSLNE